MLLPLLRQIHRWIGLLIALPVAVQGLSGCILNLADLVPDRQTTSALARPVGEIVAAAQVRIGDGARATRYFAPSGIGYEARVEVAAAGGPPHVLHIDPSTLAILAVDPPADRALAWVRSLHVQFLAQAYGGRSIGGWFGIGLLTMLVTAVPIWWPRKRNIRQAFVADFRARGAMFHRRLHGAAGAWIFAALAVLTATGIVMAFPRTSRGVLGLEQREPPAAGRPSEAFVTPPADIDRAIALGRQARPDAELRMAFLPARRSDPIRLSFSQSGQAGAVGAIQMQVSLADERVRIADDPATRKPAENVYRWTHDLHTASGIGDWWRVVSGLSGLALPLLSITGCMMWWRKRSARRRLSGIRQDAATAMKQVAE